MWHGGCFTSCLFAFLPPVSCPGLALVCCTYAPLNHEMQSNLRSSNGKYFPHTQRPPPHTSDTLKYRPWHRGWQRGGWMLSVHVSLPARTDSEPPTHQLYNSILSFWFWIFEIAWTWNSTTTAPPHYRASRVNEKDTHVNFNFCFWAFCSFGLPLERCLPQGLLKLATSCPRGLTLHFSTFRRCCSAQSVTFFSQFST